MEFKNKYLGCFLFLVFFLNTPAFGASRKCELQAEFAVEVFSSSIILYVRAAKKLNEIDLTTIETYGELAANLEKANVLITMTKDENPLVRVLESRNFYSECGSLTSKEDAYFVQVFTVKEYSEFINRSNENLFPVESEALSKLRLGVSTVTPLFKFGGYNDAISYIYDAGKRLLDAKESIIASIDKHAKDSDLELEKIKNDVEYLNVKIEEEQARQRKKRELEIKREKAKRELQTVRNQTNSTEQMGSKGNSSYRTKGTEGTGLLSKTSWFCVSEVAFKRQRELLGRNRAIFADGCTGTVRDERVWLKDISMFSGTCILELVKNQRDVWALCGSYESD